MDFAKLDTQIEILHAVTTQDALGEIVKTWQVFATVFAQKLSRPGREFFQSSRVISETRTYFIIRHLPGVTPQMKVCAENIEYEVIDILESDKRRESLQLECKRVV